MTVFSARRPCTPGSPCILLLVEDEQGFRQLFSDLLTELGGQRFALESVRSLEDMAQVLAVRTNVDAIILDLGLSGSDGITTLKRALEITKHEVPVIVLTAGPDLEEEAIELGAVSYCGKTEINVRDFLRLVRLAVAHQRFLNRLKDEVRKEAIRLDNLELSLTGESQQATLKTLKEAITGIRQLATNL